MEYVVGHLRGCVIVIADGHSTASLAPSSTVESCLAKDSFYRPPYVLKLGVRELPP